MSLYNNLYRGWNNKLKHPPSFKDSIDITFIENVQVVQMLHRYTITTTVQKYNVSNKVIYKSR